MVKYEDGCVGCGLPCLYESCPHYRVERHYCDKCDDYAVAEIDGEELCEEHANKQLTNWFDELSISEKCEALGVDYNGE